MYFRGESREKIELSYNLDYIIAYIFVAIIGRIDLA